MNQASPVELRQSLEVANLFVRHGIPFICVPYLSETERNALIEMSQKALEIAANMETAMPVTEQQLKAELAEKQKYVLELESKLAEAEKDAKRYRYLRSNSTGPSAIWELMSDDAQPQYFMLKSEAHLDEAIDADIAAQEKP